MITKKETVLVKDEDKYKQVTLCPSQLSPDGTMIKLGGFHSDEVTGWHKVKDVENSIQTVLKTFDDA